MPYGSNQEPPFDFCTLPDFQIVVTIFAAISWKQAKAEGALDARRRRTWSLTLWRMTGTYKPVEVRQFGRTEYVAGRLSILKLAHSRIRQSTTV